MFEVPAEESPSRTVHSVSGLYSLVIYVLNACINLCTLKNFGCTFCRCQHQFVVMCWFLDVIHHPPRQQPQPFFLCLRVCVTSRLGL